MTQHVENSVATMVMGGKMSNNATNSAKPESNERSKDRLPLAVMSVHSKKGIRKNIGDYIQAVAANQFMGSSKFVDRDELKSYDGESCKLILNGWFMHRPEEFPPSEKIVSLVTSFHITPPAIKGMLTEQGVAWLKRQEPIGCRDRATCRLLKEKGIQAYFSSCLTLTLGLSYKNSPQISKILFVDPVIPHTGNALGRQLLSPKMWANLCRYLIPTFVIGWKMKKNCDYIDDGAKGLIKAFVYASLFVKYYKSVFSIKSLMSSDYASNLVKWNKIENDHADEMLMRIADETLKHYERYPLVVTSRIHCALPCLAMGTPVLFVYDRQRRKNGRMTLSADAGRQEGLLDYFNTMSFDKHWKLSADFKCQLPISASSVLPQNDSWREDAARLAEQCAKFASKEER